MPEVSKPYLAFDLGAESGRAVLAQIHSGAITLEKVHRFLNKLVEHSGALDWDGRDFGSRSGALPRVGQIERGAIGIDAWVVDYALVGERGRLLENPYPLG